MSDVGEPFDTSSNDADRFFAHEWKTSIPSVALRILARRIHQAPSIDRTETSKTYRRR
jgi:hypothetical protein